MESRAWYLSTLPEHVADLTRRKWAAAERLAEVREQEYQLALEVATLEYQISLELFKNDYRARKGN